MANSYPLPVLVDQGLSQSDVEALRAAVAALERQSFATRLAGLASRQLSFGAMTLPPRLQAAVAAATQKALAAAMKMALASLDAQPAKELHTHSPASGGADGRRRRRRWTSEPAARTAGVDDDHAALDRGNCAGRGRGPASPGRRPCLSRSFCAGRPFRRRRRSRGRLSRAPRASREIRVRRCTFYDCPSDLQRSGACLVCLIGAIWARFGMVVSQKTAAQAVPIIGAISGAAINVAFTEHFRKSRARPFRRAPTGAALHPRRGACRICQNRPLRGLLG